MPIEKVMTRSKKYKFITIKVIPLDEFNGKPLYAIVNNKTGDELGKLFYYKPWKQYCFTQASEGCVFNKDCLRDIIDFIEKEI